MIVDRMLPGMEGLAIVAALRAAHDQTPVLVLGAMGDVDDRIEGLRAGCEDYLTKPFGFAERLAHLEAAARRPGSETRLNLADLEMDLLARRATRAGRPIDLPPREFRLLEYLMRHAEHIVTRMLRAAG